ncbi:hypothetical protein [Roseixanthobacter liquoris]|uniref:hypothetical protein n=1 Tax=Roseixanthobacter liquoris TaxID=3119921 RepID=UPI003728528C
MIGLLAGIACFSAVIRVGLELREMMIAASGRLNAVPVNALAQAIPSIHRTNQAVLWHYVLMIGFTIVGLLVSGAALIAWWGSRIAVRHPEEDDPRERPGIAPFPRRNSLPMEINGKRYLIR